MAPAFANEAALSAFIEPLLKLLDSSKHVENVRLFERVAKTLSAVDSFLVDAEDKKSKDARVFLWLGKLQDTVYDLDDLVDEIITHDARREWAAKSQQPTPTWMQMQKLVPTLIPSTSKSIDKHMKRKFDSIIRKLEDLRDQATVLGLKRSSENRNKGAPDEAFLRFPSSTEAFVDDFVVGRDKDKEQIVEFLLSDDVNSRDGISVISIVGMGGLGKTTLARLVFNDERVKNHFNERAWVYAGQDLDPLASMKSILVAVTGQMSKSSDLGQVQNMLEDCLLGKRFLLVLDDVRFDAFETWRTLRMVLTAVARASKIIVTTRSDNVSAMVATTPSYHLNFLNDEGILCLFAKYAFGNQFTISRVDFEIQTEIARKCRGLPLAARLLGCSLRFKSVQEWRDILNYVSWGMKDTFRLQSLELCYSILPAHLKRCVAYCALFPGFYEFEKEKLVRLWMAEGFLPQSKVKTEEDAGGNYFHDLLQMSFFQSSSTRTSCFVMHEFIKDFALASEVFSVRLDHSNSEWKPSERVRYLSYTKRDVSNEFIKLISVAKRLRTLLSINLLSDNGHCHLTYEVLQNLSTNLPRLRVLALPFYDITKVPYSIGKLKHLRYLDLSHTALKSLPGSITSLYNLQTLDLSYCQFLNKLPEDLWKLVKLLHLLISESGVQEMPSSMSRLTNLQTLTNFILSRGGSKIMELSGLSNLHGALSISKLEILRSEKEAFDFKLEGMKHIDELELKWSGESTDPGGDESVLEYLMPSTRLNRLVIESYSGRNFPYWLGFSSFSKMVFLGLSNCKNCLHLPPVGQLESLQVLEVKGLDGITKLGPEIYGMHTQRPFKSLQILKFDNMLNWEEWETRETEDGAFPSIQELHITNCPNLKGHMPKFFPSLNKLVISECMELVKFIRLPLTSSQCNISIDDKKIDPRCDDKDVLPASSDANEVCSVNQECFLEENVERASNYSSQCSVDFDAAELEELQHRIRISSPPQEFASEITLGNVEMHDIGIASQSTLSISKTTTTTNEVDDQVEAFNIYPESSKHLYDARSEELPCSSTASILSHKVPSRATQSSSPHHIALQSCERRQLYIRQGKQNIRLVRCPRCRQILPELPNVDVYQCGGCGTLIKGQRYEDKDALRISSDGNDISSQKQECSLQSASLLLKTASKIIEADIDHAEASNSSPQRSAASDVTGIERLPHMTQVTCPPQEVPSQTFLGREMHDIVSQPALHIDRATAVIHEGDDQAEDFGCSPGNSKLLHDTRLEKLHHAIDTSILPREVASETTQASTSHDVALQSSPRITISTRIARQTDDETEPINSEDGIEYQHLSHGILKVSDVLQLGKLPTDLHSLIIEGCDNREFLPFKILSTNPSILHLYVVDCGFSGISFAKGGCNTSLKTLHIQNCLKLKFPSSSEMVRQCADLEDLCLGNSCESLECFPLNLFPKLEVLCLWGCMNLYSFSFEKGLACNSVEALESLEMRDCPNLRCFPEGGFYAPNLTSIIISNCHKLQSLPDQMHCLKSLRSLFISKCEELTSLPSDGLPESLNLLCITSCDNITLRVEWKLKELGALTHFEIEGGCSDIESFPEEGLLPDNLIQLRISRLAIRYLDPVGLQQLTLLEKLEINCCKSLLHLPEELPSSLSFLSIKECPLLKAKLQKRTKRDWYRFADIPTIFVDDVEFH